jgi:hypothetical protein
MKFGDGEHTAGVARLARAALREKRCGVCGRGAAVVNFRDGYESPNVFCEGHDPNPLSQRDRALTDLNTIEQQLGRVLKSPRHRTTKAAGTDSARARLAKAERDSELARLNKLARRA